MAISSVDQSYLVRHGSEVLTKYVLTEFEVTWSRSCVVNLFVISYSVRTRARGIVEDECLRSRFAVKLP